MAVSRSRELVFSKGRLSAGEEENILGMTLNALDITELHTQTLVKMACFTLC